MDTPPNFVRLLILYGSQTGTAQDAAETIAMQSRTSHFRASVMDVDSYPIEKLVEETLTIFFCSTTGQGEPPDNMLKFWKFIMRRNLPNDSLRSMRYGVLGFGDSSYAKFNFIAKKLDRRLQQLGATRLINVGLADDQHELGPDTTVDAWTTTMWEKLLQAYPLPTGMTSPLSQTLPPPFFEIRKSGTNKITENGTGSGNNHEIYNRSNPFIATIKSNIRVTAEYHFQKTMLITLDVSHAKGNLSYNPGDVVMIRPSNTEENVKRFVGLFSQFSYDEAIHVVLTDKCVNHPAIFDHPTTLLKFVTDYFDFMAIPRRSFFQLLRHFAADDTEREKLDEFASPEGTDARYSYANRPRRTILEVLEEFHETSKNISLQRLFDIMPSIQPRAFSIASSPSVHRDVIQVLVAVVRYKTKLHLPRQGLCSTWLSNLHPGATVAIWLKKGAVHYPTFSKSESLPIIMIGPGTGVAPHRSAIHERIHNGVNDNILFFGCRNRAGDYYFEDEWEKLVSDGRLTVITCFSRDQDDKIYVQHKIAENGAWLWDLIQRKNASIYVAGNSKNMPDSVRDTFLEIFQKFGDMNKEESMYFYENLLKQKRYQQETWS